jgi:CHAT domain
MQRKITPPPDLEMRVRTLSENGRTRLSYTLHSPAGVAPFTHLEIDGPFLRANPEELHRSLLHQLGELGARRDVGQELLLRDEIDRKLIRLGRDLWRQLFSEEMRQAYRRFRSVRSLLIISDEPWIPWEMVKPFDDEGEILNDPFFAEQFELTRWLSGRRALPGDLSVHALACVTGPGHLPLASQEKDVVRRLAQEKEGLLDATPNKPGVDTLTELLEEGGLGLLHFALHGTFDPAMPNEAGLPLADGSVFRPSDLHGPVQTQISQDKPLIVLNACGSGRQAWMWTGLGGWADRWVRVCGCGAFIGPLWQVRDSAAFTFAQGLYNALARGETLGKAAQETRLAARDVAAGDPSWLAYTVYGHPNARVVLGVATLPEIPVSLPQSRIPPLASPKPVPAASTNLRIKKKFSDQEKDQFVEETFESIASFFERSLGQLEQQNPGVGTRFRRIDSDHFSARIYVPDQKPSTCRIWLSRGHMGDIAYHWDDSAGDNTYSAILWVENDGYSMWFKPGLQVFSSGKERLNAQEAAEYFWSMLIKRLQ